MPAAASFVKAGDRAATTSPSSKLPRKARMSQLPLKILAPRAWTQGGAALLVLAFTACAGHTAPRSSSLAGLATAGLTFDAGASVNSSLGDYLAGSFALESGQLAEAATYFEQALGKDPDNEDLLRQLFLLTLASGRYDDAHERAARLVSDGSAVAEAELLLALEEVRTGRFDPAHRRLQTLSDDGIAGLTVPFIDAWIVLARGGGNDLDDALARLEDGESLGPLNGYHRAMMLDLGGRLNEAVAALNDAMPDGPAPMRMLQAYASLLARQNQRQTAIEVIRQQLADRGEQPVLVDLVATLEAGGTPAPPFEDAVGGIADALLGIAEALYQERGNRMAVVYARLALFARRDLAEASLLIGDMMAEQDNLDAAIEAYQAVAPDSPLFQVAQLRQARALHDLERSDEAFALLEELAQAQPERIDALVQLGDLRRHDEAYGEAEDAYSRAIARLGEAKREHWTLLYARGIAYERTERWPEAEADFLHALELEPEQPFVLNYLGYSWVDKGLHLDRAKGMLNRAVELRPDDGFIVDSLGWVHFRLGEYDAAVQHLERAVELEPGDPVINDHLGDAYWRVGRQREARYQWRRALTLDPEEDAIAEIEQKLRSGLPRSHDEEPRRT
jgi:tetratricopeptide (TPR) repeat protein